MTVGAMEGNASKCIEIGSRIRAEDGHFGTVLYIGPVQGTKGEWYGVEWDSADRGKHDGEHEGVRYFNARKGSASFIRPKKILPSTTFCKELSDRYGMQQEPNAGVSAEQLYVGDGSGHITKVEMVGAEKVNRLQSQFERLQIIVLRDCQIRGIEPGVDLGTMTPKVVDLNLSKNLLTSWHDVAQITRHLPTLKILNLSENRLRGPECAEKLADGFRALKTLFLNRMGIDFDEVLEWSRMWPCVQELHICFNGIEVLTIPEENYLKNVKLMNLEGNPLEYWEEVMKLQDLKNLETLVLNNTGMKCVELKKCGPNSFCHLLELSLCANQISDWSCINELNRLKLLDLKLNGNPLLVSDSWENVRDIICAKIRSLKFLNRTEITGQERKGAELCYLKRFGPEWLKSGGSSDPNRNDPSMEFLDNHPRFQELVDKYGAPEETEMHRAPQGLKDSLVAIEIKGPNKSIKKKLPTSMTVQKLKTLVQRLMKADMSSLVLTDVGQGQGHRVELDNDLRELSFYSLENDDVLEATW